MEQRFECYSEQVPFLSTAHKESWETKNRKKRMKRHKDETENVFIPKEAAVEMVEQCLKEKAQLLTSLSELLRRLDVNQLFQEKWYVFKQDKSK